ncbi:MAG: Clp1/GlmU family protein [Candidatus Bathyarchaeota archaeon]|nr:Clp1/GlmU family protein [Candidatus Bathyarchaeota archaeon]MDH5787292.1 Clp1/GlmU family protein [Candidatus Bathyarchaeota archaeon]
MKRTIEKGKTLLVDGPASVTATSGKVTVFGSIVGSTNKIVIREGKRLPFFAEQSAAFDISLGENANIEEVEDDTIPISWSKATEEIRGFQTTPLTAIVLGTVDSGKTSFCTYLINKLLNKKSRVAILDGDLGQSDIGPPCTVAYTFIVRPVTDLFNLKAENAFFAGVTSPSKVTTKVVEGLATLKKEILGNNPDVVVINTDGWVEGEDAVKYKVRLVEELKPELVFCIQRKEELALFLNNLERYRRIVVDFPTAARQRSSEKRKNIRELGYVKYLRDAKIQSLPLDWLKIEGNEVLGLGKTHQNIKRARKIYELLGMRPLHLAELRDKICIVIGARHWIDWECIKKVEEYTKKKITVFRKGEEKGLLTALYDGHKKFLGIGVLQEIDYVRKVMKIFTPASREISTVTIGEVKLDKNMKEIPTFAEDNRSEFMKFSKLF